MYLKSIVVQGFKSFPDKTTISFTDGITAIVGPNGSGKSNIVDAIRWVLGEQSSKTLRGSKMEDVIFNGTSARKQSGFAEVTLNMDNSDGALPVDLSEVSVTRRLYRSGESEYLMCEKPTRLKDITELFMNTGVGRDGYSIIGQGKIAEVLAAKSEERRSIFEEAAGISKYRYRKNEAERKLNSTQDNLLRVHDILNELEGRIGPLRIQSEKAKAFLAFSGEKKQLEINVWLNSIDKTAETKAAVAEKLETAQRELDAVIAKYDADFAKIDELTEFTQNKYVEMDKLRFLIKTAQERLSALEKEKAVKENDILHARERIERINGMLEAGQTKFAEYDRLIAEKRAEQDAVKAKIAEVTKELEQITRDCENELLSQGEYMDKANKITAEIAVLTGKLTDEKIKFAAYKAQIDGQDDKISEIDDEIERKQGQITEQKKQMAGAKAEYDQCKAVIDENENIIAGYRKKLEGRQGQLDMLLEKIRKCDSEIVSKTHKMNLLSDMEAQREGFAHSVKAVMREASVGRLKNVYGTIGELIQVDAKYSVAIETALGGAIQNIIVNDENDAKMGIMYLKRENLGRATFAPIASVKGTMLNASAIKGEAGFVGVASALIGFDKKYEGVLNYYIGATVVADNIDNATAMAKKNGYKFKVVTLDGQVVNKGGSFTGGSQSKGSGLLSRKNEIEKLKADIEKLERENAETQKSATKLKEETGAVTAGLDGALAELGVAKENIIRAEGTVNQYKALIQALNEAIDELDEEKTAIIAGGTDAKLKAAELEREIAKLEKVIADKDDQFAQATQGQADAARKREELSSKIAEMKMHTVSLEKDVETIDGLIDRIEQERKTVTSELANSGEEIALENQKIAELVAEVEAFDKESAGCTEEIEASNLKIKNAEQQRNEAEKTVIELRKTCNAIVVQREDLLKEVERCQAKKDAIDAEYDIIVAKLWDEYELTLTEAYCMRTELEDVNEANRRISELRAKIKHLGSVNVDAIQEYREVKERYDFLKAQVEDLETAKADLETLIANLTVEMRKIFTEQFKVIRENFSQVFAELFGGGKATLELTDPTDALTSGIDIIACPPGKVIKNISALSGGEQALTAISLYFAIMKVRPAPFCLLDEIDAPLDDVNVTRLAGYIRRMTDKSQYICITHKRGMMESADILYGVTMQERGVTKLLTINVADVEKQFGNKLG